MIEGNSQIHEDRSLQLTLYPAIANTSLKISYRGRQIKSDFDLAIYNHLGIRVRDLNDRVTGDGQKGYISWDLKDDNENRLPDGIYFVKLESRGTNIVQKAVLIGNN